MCIQNHRICQPTSLSTALSLFIFAHMVLNFFFAKNDLTTQIKWLHRNRTIDKNRERKKKRAVVSNRHFYKHETNPWNIIENNLHSFLSRCNIFQSIGIFNKSCYYFFVFCFITNIRIFFSAIVFASCAIVIAFHVDASSKFMVGTKLKNILFPDIYFDIVYNYKIGLIEWDKWHNLEMRWSEKMKCTTGSSIIINHIHLLATEILNVQWKIHR